MRIAVFGGSGVIGQALLPVLLERGDMIRAMRHRAPLPVEGVEAVEGDITDPDAVAETIDGAEIVLQMTKGGTGAQQAVETSAAGTINILDAIRRQGGVRQYLLTSSDAATGIWAHPHPEPISHETPPTGYGDYYSLGKVLEEVIVADYARNHGLPFTIARLSYVHQADSVLRLFIAGGDPARPTRGPFDEQYSDRQKQRLADGQQFVVLPCDGQGKPLGRTLVQRADVVEALAAMIGSPKAIDQRFHVSGPAFTYDRPCQYLAERLNLPIEEVRLSDAHSFDIDYSHTTELLGWRPACDVIAMLDAALTWRRKAAL